MCRGQNLFQVISYSNPNALDHPWMFNVHCHIQYMYLFRESLPLGPTTAVLTRYRLLINENPAVSLLEAHSLVKLSRLYSLLLNSMIG